MRPGRYGIALATALTLTAPAVWAAPAAGPSPRPVIRFLDAPLALTAPQVAITTPFPPGSRRTSHIVRLDGGGHDGTVVRLLGADDDGWHSISPGYHPNAAAKHLFAPSPAAMDELRRAGQAAHVEAAAYWANLATIVGGAGLMIWGYLARNGWGWWGGMTIGLTPLAVWPLIREPLRQPVWNHLHAAVQEWNGGR